jgi:hypothetical protein
MATKQRPVFSITPYKDDDYELTTQPPEPPDRRDLLTIFNEEQRHEYIMQAAQRKTNLGAHLAAEINKHMFREVKEMARFLYAEWQSVQGNTELYNFLGEFLKQEIPVMSKEMSAIRRAGVFSLLEAVNWSLNVLPPEEHKGFWQRLFGG